MRQRARRTVTHVDVGILHSVPTVLQGVAMWRLDSLMPVRQRVASCLCPLLACLSLTN